VKLVEQVVEIEAPPIEVYEHFVDPERFVRWMAPTARLDPRPGGTLRWTHANGDSCEGSFVELVPARRIVFTYGWDRVEVEVPPGSTTVAITLEPIASGTRLRLVHSGLAGPMADAHAGGWANYLGRLTIVAEGDDPGPDPLAEQRVPTPRELGMT
jgi:uncharacterized protein YndB with AHSA1/START domain